VFVITVTFAPGAAALNARSDDEGDVSASLRRSDKADRAALPALEGLAGSRIRLSGLASREGMWLIEISLAPTGKRWRNCKHEH